MTVLKYGDIIKKSGDLDYYCHISTTHISTTHVKSFINRA